MELRRSTLAKVLVGVFVLNLVVMGAGAYLAYQEAPPIPKGVVGPDGDRIATDADVRHGKVVFQQDGLMNHGSILGNGAYFGPDYTADALDLKVREMRDYYAREEHGRPYGALSESERAAIDARVESDLSDGDVSGPVEYSPAEAYAHRQVREIYDRELVQLLFWARLPGDSMIVLATAMFAVDVVRKLGSIRETTAEDALRRRIPDRVLASDD